MAVAGELQALQYSGISPRRVSAPICIHVRSRVITNRAICCVSFRYRGQTSTKSILTSNFRSPTSRPAASPRE